MRFRGYIFDMDGTLFRGQSVIDSALEVVRRLADQGAIILYATNNSTQRPESYEAKLNAMGYPVSEPDAIVTSATATAHWLRDSRVEHVHVFGEPALEDAIREVGAHLEEPGQAEACVVGLVRTNLSYARLDSAMQAARNSGRLIGTNPDRTYPLAGGQFCPGAGSILAAVEACSGVTPIIIGKPAPLMFTQLMLKFSLESDEVCVVGDRLDTDILAGQSCGCATYLTLTGVENSLPEGQWGGATLAGLLDD